MEPGQKRDEFSQIIGSYMKMAFKNWNKEHYVSDELIKNDLLQMSKGQLAIEKNVQIKNFIKRIRYEFSSFLMQKRRTNNSCC